METPIHIALCMGSSCFARGNNRVLDVLERVIEENGWKHKVHLSGLRCQNHCADGPNLTIDGELYQGLDSGAILDLLSDKLGVDKGSATVSSVRRQDGGE
ncbi:MAG: (2Fe-2S) ferredoxin domain-containing protein [Planctomycetaceae bacterium]|nr:(2Fe-2S) ferredoxin domain-containing protein [Planctomycetaceae bacterium]